MLVHMNRAMQFLYGSDTIYNCSAGKTLLAILADGTLLPCRRLPIKVGNLLEKDINSYWVSSSILKELQDNEIPEECKSCLVSDKCKGGAKCLTYAVNKTYNKKDVNCYI